MFEAKDLLLLTKFSEFEKWKTEKLSGQTKPTWQIEHSSILHAVHGFQLDWTARLNLDTSPKKLTIHKTVTSEKRK